MFHTIAKKACVKSMAQSSPYTFKNYSSLTITGNKAVILQYSDFLANLLWILILILYSFDKILDRNLEHTFGGLVLVETQSLKNFSYI